MVSGNSIGSLAARAAVFMMSVRSNTNELQTRADRSVYDADSFNAIKALQTWYNSGSGLWDTTGWWNSANCLTVLADFAAINKDEANTLSIASIVANTFSQAQKTNVNSAVVKTMSPSGLITSSYVGGALDKRGLEKRGFSNFLNDYYDDEGWWALALIHSYDFTGNKDYLTKAQSIYEDMKGGVERTKCGGGIWWSKAKTYKNAIANELFLSVAASLANRAPNDASPNNKLYYLNEAKAQWTWFKNSGMINSQNLINDGLTINSDGSCTNNGQNTWTYNQGVILGGLTELSKATGDTSLLTTAVTIANAAIKALSDSNGILHESCENSGCGGDGAQFKGIFVRNLHYLNTATPQASFKTFLQKNADSIWASDRDTSTNKLGLKWNGPVTQENGPNAGTHSSALDALVAALAVS